MTSGYDYRQYKTLFVDDEPQALKYFERTFGKDFSILTAISVADAWDIIQQQHEQIGIVITDQRMPGEKGVDLLERLSADFPRIVRILTTAYSDLQSAIDSVNLGGAFRYITKPWDVHELRGALLRAMEFFLVRQERDRLVRQKIGVMQRLVVMDRVRGLASLAAALSCRFDGTMDALRSYAEQSLLDKRITSDHEYFAQVDLLEAARTQGVNLVQAIRDVLEKTDVRAHDPRQQPIVLEEVLPLLLDQLQNELTSEGVTFQLTPARESLQLTANPRLMSRLFEILIRRLADMDGEDREIRISTHTPDDGDGAIVRIATDGPSWSNGQRSSLFSAIIPIEKWPMGIEMDILSAFFIAHHYRGGVKLLRHPPLGPGFEVSLQTRSPQPATDTLDKHWFDTVFRSLETWGSIAES